jgi:NAD(P)H-hydrate epimerase
MHTHSTPLQEADALGWPTLSVDQSRQVDRVAIEKYGVRGITLMENAGKACADRLLDKSTSDDCLILAGSGNNGGDGFVIARHFQDAGIRTRVVLMAPTSKLRGDAQTSYKRAIKASVEIESCVDADEVARTVQRHHGPVVDCMLGTGATGTPREPYATAIRLANEMNQPRTAIDLPSGLDGDTGVASEPAFQADLTLTFVTAKNGMRNEAAFACLGKIEIIDIGLPAAMVAELGLRG